MSAFTHMEHPYIDHGDHKGGAVYGTDEESPTTTRYGDESWSFCTDNGSPNGYSSAVSTCAKSEVDD